MPIYAPQPLASLDFLPFQNFLAPFRFLCVSEAGLPPARVSLIGKGNQTQ